MNQSSKDTILFCADYIENNFKEYSQVSHCRTWVKTAVDLLKNEKEFNSADYIISEFLAIDNYLSGKDGFSNSGDILTKISTIKILMND